METQNMITGTQARGARAMLRMTVVTVAQAAGIAPNTIVRVEADRSVNTGTLDAIQAVYEAAGVRFMGEGCVCAPARAENPT